MKLSKSCSIGLIVILSVCFYSGLTQKALAEQLQLSCIGIECNDKDPVEYNCHTDAYVVEEVTTTVYRWQDFWQPKQIIVQQIYSEKCRANWTKAYIPDDSYLFIREQAPDPVNGNGRQINQGLYKANGTGYFWAYGNMANGNVINQACVAFPGIPIPMIGNSYERYCTGFN